MQARRILSLDLATRIGFAFGDIGEKPEFGAHVLDRTTGEDFGRWIETFSQFLGGGNSFLQQFAAIDGRGVDLVVYEAPILPRFTKVHITRKLYSLGSFLEWRCFKQGVPIREIHLQHMKRFWSGKGNAKKPDMVAAARRHGFDLGDKQEDEADALAGWWFTVNHISPKHAASITGGGNCDG